MINILSQHRHQMPTSKDQHPVQQLPPHRAHPPLRGGVRPRRPHRRPQGSDALRGEDGVEGSGELRVTVRIKNLHRLMRSAKSMRGLRACWATHAPVGLMVTPRTWTRRVASSITNSTYRRLSSTVSTWKQVARHDPLGLRGQELPPGQARAARRRVDARSLEQQPHGAWRDPVPQTGEFTVNAPVGPRRVLSRHPQDQLPQLRRDRWPAGQAVGFRPVAPDQVVVPPQQRLASRTDGVDAAPTGAESIPKGWPGPARSVAAGRPVGARPRPRAVTRGSRRSWTPAGGPAARASR